MDSDMIIWTLTTVNIKKEDNFPRFIEMLERNDMRDNTLYLK